MREEVFVRQDGHEGGCVLDEFDRFFAAVGDFAVADDDIFLLPGLINQGDFQRGHIILEENRRGGDAVLCADLVAGVVEFCIVVAVRIFDVEGGLVAVTAADRRKCHRRVAVLFDAVAGAGSGEVQELLGSRYFLSEMVASQDTGLVHIEEPLDAVRLDRDDLCPDLGDGDDRVAVFLSVPGRGKNRRREQQKNSR